MNQVASPMCVISSSPIPLLIRFISWGDIVVYPIPIGLTFDSAMITTVFFAPTSGNFPPFDVNPGHITLAPPKTNLIAPKSTVQGGSK